VLSDVSILELDELPEINAKGGFTASEAYALHENLLEQSGDKYDPRVSTRIRRGENMTAADYIQLLATRRNMIARVKKIANNFDVIVMPTVPQIAPVLSQIDNDEDNYHRANLLMLRNPTVTNFLDGCAVSIPCHEPDAAPVGLMLMGMDGADQKILRIGMTVENALQART
jgi:aspartyl-tRNA(Asn)/glutamyl-tRNA(Gln) amidotransferase subunit A